VKVGYKNSKDKIKALKNILFIQEFVDVFLEEIPSFPPKRDIDFNVTTPSTFT